MCLSAKANIALKNFDSAKLAIEDAIRLFPDFAVAHETLGDLMLVQDQTGAARKAYEHAMRLDPTQANILKKIDKSRTLEKEVADKPVSLLRPTEI